MTLRTRAIRMGEALTTAASWRPRASRTVLDLDDPAAVGDDGPRYEQHLHELSKRTSEALDRGEPNPDLLLDDVVSPGTRQWMALRKHAIALHPLYSAPHLLTLGAGLTMADLDEPLVDGTRPFDLLARLTSPEVAHRVRARYDTFINQPVTDALRLMLSYGLDSRQIRWRAAAAAELARQAAKDWDDDLRIVSLACGAAGPVARFADSLIADGHQIAALHLVDRDPVALAAGRAIARSHLSEGRIEVDLVDLVDLRTGVAAPLSTLWPHEQAHLVDILGLFEYLPDATAISLLEEARNLLLPGGAIVLGNMLDVRPQQSVFTDLIQWPALVQRSVDDLERLISEAGFDLEGTDIVTASPAEAVYAVACMRT